MENNLNRLNVKTERLEIRNLKMDDLTDFHAYRSNPEVTKYQGIEVFTFEEANSFIEEHNMKEFVFLRRVSNYKVRRHVPDGLVCWICGTRSTTKQ